MTTNKKYDYRITQKETGWVSEITRRVTAKKTMVSKSRSDFATEADARAWCEKELALFRENLTRRNKRDFKQHLKNKKDKALREEAYQQKKQDPGKPEPE